MKSIIKLEMGVVQRKGVGAGGGHAPSRKF